MNIAMLLGSVRQGRQSQKVAHYLRTLIADRSVQPDLIDLAEYQLPIYGSENGEDKPAVTQIGARLDRADALVIITPEYHGSFPGALKNALDFFWPEFQRKPIGVVAVSAGKFGGINAANQLQQVILSLGGVALPVKMLVSEVHDAFDTDGSPRDARLPERAGKFLDEFLWYAEAIYEKKSVTHV